MATSTTAFCAGDRGALCPDLWPQNIAYGTIEGGMPPREKYNFLPGDWEVLDGMLKVERRLLTSQDRSRRMLVCPKECDEQQELRLSLWGFVKAVNMGTTGGWNGKPETAARAMRSVTLHAGGCDVAFNPQMDLVNSIRQYVGAVLQGGPPSLVDKELDLLHKVFRRANASEKGKPARYMQGEDPTGRAGDISRDWRLIPRPRVGKLAAGGAVSPMSALAVRPGDFVEVQVTPDVVYIEKPGANPNFVKVNMHIVCVTRLYTEEETKAMQLPVAIAQLAASASMIEN